jgi:DNA mismatch repair ATPase MutS
MDQSRHATNVHKRPRDTAIPRDGRRDRVATLLNALDDVADAPQTMLALTAYRNATLGYAWLAPDAPALVRCGHLHETVNDPVAIPSLLRALCPPIAVVLPSTFPRQLVQAVQQFTSGAADLASAGFGEDTRRAGQCVVVSYLPSAEFAPSSLGESLRVLWPERDPARWAAKADLGHPAVAGAVAALLTLAMRKGTPVRDVEPHSAGDIVRVDAATLHELGIFRTEEHPASTRGVGVPREGLSVYGLLNRARTAEGRALLRRWCLLPTSDLGLLRARLASVRVMVSPASREALVRVIGLLKLLRPVQKLFDKLRCARCTAADYKGIVDTCQATLAIAHELHPLCLADSDGAQPADARSAVRFAAAHHLCATLSGDHLRHIVAQVSRCVDFGQPDAKLTAHVREGAHLSVDEHRRACGSLDAYLTEVALLEAADLPSSARDWPLKVVFLPQAGYLVDLDSPSSVVEYGEGFGAYHSGPHAEEVSTRWNIDDDADAVAADGDATGRDAAKLPFQLPPQWELAFENAGSYFLKTPRMLELDRRVGDLKAAAVESELEVLGTLDAQLYELLPFLDPLRHLAEIDCICALAATALEEGWREPSFSGPGGPLKIDGARHPLLARANASGTVVPFSIGMGLPAGASSAEAPQEARRVAFITGPNGSGKSALLASVAITVFLGHIGSFVPCEMAVLPLIDHLAVNDRSCVATLEALVRTPASTSTAGSGWGGGHPAGSKQLQAPASIVHSSFGHELSVVGRMFRSATPRSLILLDEFANGTLADDGVALLASLVRWAIAPADLVSTGEAREADAAAAFPRPPTNSEGRPPATGPLLLVATHFTQLLRSDVVPTSSVQWLTMKVAVHGSLGAPAATHGTLNAHLPNPLRAAAATDFGSAALEPADDIFDEDGFRVPGFAVVPPGTPRARLDATSVVRLDRAALATPRAGNTPACLRQSPPQAAKAQRRSDTHAAARPSESDVPPVDSAPRFDDVVIPYFTPVPGSHVASHSNALACAHLAGVDAGVVSRASALLAFCLQANELPPMMTPAYHRD